MRRRCSAFCRLWWTGRWSSLNASGRDTRYRLLETIREYGEERLAEFGETEAVRDRHAEHYYTCHASLYERPRGPEQPEVVRLLRAETDNLLAAMAYALDTRNVDLALRLLTAKAGHLGVSAAAFLPVDALSIDGAVDHPLYPRAEATAAYYSALRGDPPTAEEHIRVALAAAERLPSPDPIVEYLVCSRAGQDGELCRRSRC